MITKCDQRSQPLLSKREASDHLIKLFLFLFISYQLRLHPTKIPQKKLNHFAETFSSLLRFNISKKSQAFGFIEPHNEEEGGERAIAMFLRENAGTVTVESDVMGEIGFDFTFSVADLNPGSYDASRVLTGEYSGMRGKGRAEVTLTANTFFATVVNATANEPFTTIIGDRIQAETKKPTQFMDQVFLGLMVFAVAAVVNIVRSALFPKQKVR